MDINLIKEAITESIEVKKSLLDAAVLNSIQTASSIAYEAINTGKKILIAGNGGSAADSQHIAAEFVSRFMFDRPAMAAVALTTDTSALTAIGNDYGFVNIFSRQILSIGNKGDVFIGISTSGNSENIHKAAITAKEMGLVTIGFAGKEGNIWSDFDHTIRVPSTITARIQESHILIGHIICQLVEAKKWKS